MPKVSVIINCHNGEEYLEECLISINKQNYSDYEIIFWDNCSTDNSAEIAKHFERVKYYKSEYLEPLGAARNLALDKISGEYFAYIDCDDIWEPNKLELQVAELENNQDVGLVLTNYTRFNMLKNEQIIVYNRKKKILDFSELVLNYHFCLSSFMIRRSALNGLDHYFNEQFQYAEEFELFSRIAYKWKTVFLPQSLVTYRIHKRMNTMLLQDRKYLEYNIILENLRSMAPLIDKEHPNVMRWIEFNRDYNMAKSALQHGENKKSKLLMKKYIWYNKRALVYYLISIFPKSISRKLINKLYMNRY